MNALFLMLGLKLQAISHFQSQENTLVLQDVDISAGLEPVISLQPDSSSIVS